METPEQTYERKARKSDITLAECRPQVLSFAILMEEVLRENDHKGGWEDCDLEDLSQRIWGEAFELSAAVRPFYQAICMGDAVSDLMQIEIGNEAADVANYAMMVADLVHALPANDAVAGIVAVPVELLIEMEGVFRNYETLHRDKGTREGFAKADANAAHADKIAAAIRAAQGESADG